MAATMKGLLKGLRYISQIFDEEKEPAMQIGLPTDVKHVAHIGSDGPSANTPSWMNEFKGPHAENGEAGGYVKNQATKLNTEGNSQTRGVGLQELLPPTHNERRKHKLRRKSGAVSPDISPTRRSDSLAAEMPPKQSRHNRISRSSMDSSSNQDSSSHRRRRQHHSVPNMEASNPLADNSAVPPRKPTSRHRKNKGSTGGELSVKGSKGKEDKGSSQRGCFSSIDIRTGNAEV